MAKAALLLPGLLLLAACAPGAKDPATDEPAAIEASRLIAAAHGFPALRDLDGRTLADGDFTQQIESGRLHITIRYDFGAGRQIEEQAFFEQSPQPVQVAWTWQETREDRPFRRFMIDFVAGTTSAEKHGGEDAGSWAEDIDVEPGRAFAGFGFTVALKAFRERLLQGDPIELQAVVFRPKPGVVDVALSHGGIEQMRVSGRLLRGDRFDIKPQIPWIVDLFVEAPEVHVWLTDPPPAEFLRWEGPLLEPDDPVVRVDLLPGRESGPAQPVPRARSH